MMLAEGQERFFRTVTGRGQSVRAQSHPCEKGDQGDLVEGFFFLWVDGLSEKQALDFLDTGGCCLYHPPFYCKRGASYMQVTLRAAVKNAGNIVEFWGRITAHSDCR